MAQRTTGLKELRAKIRALPAEMKTRLRTALEENAEELTGMQKRLVPVDHGDLRNSIAWTYGDPPETAVLGRATKGNSATATAQAGDLKVSVYAGDKKAFYARFVEFGVAPQKAGQRITNASGRNRKSGRTTRGQAAQPFFFPAYRSLKKRLKSRSSRAVTKAVKEIAGNGT